MPEALPLDRILVDVDPERTAANPDRLPAVERARQLAAAGDASLDLFVCDHLESIGGGTLFDNESLEKARNEYLQDLKDWLELHAERLRQESITVDTHVVWHAPRFEALLEMARETGAGMIVRAARKRSRIGRILFAATDWELIRRAPQLLWLVKRQSDLLSRGIRLLVAVDPTHPEERRAGLDEKLIRVANGIIGLFGGAVHLFHAYSPGAMVAPIAAASHHGAVPVLRLSSELVGEHERYRDREVRKLAAASGIPEDHVHLVAGDVTDSLVDLVAELDIDAVVAGAIARGRIERFLIGSTAEAILDEVECDVIVVKPDGFGEAQQDAA